MNNQNGFITIGAILLNIIISIVIADISIDKALEGKCTGEIECEVSRSK